ncbi:hybrid sensor histidine kinase/response regulator [Chitinophaga sp. HK235]|uniref:ATP-binding response regulator n=1 Tax=Chitinophaga sp. HK235 TaxID=2952571 RepID=UPI001BA94FBA|nr:hybrid sensor histidine kinase/response regulator [Chitinophaga sp. HK235]
MHPIRTLLLAGTPGMPVEDKNRVIILSTLSFLTVVLAGTIGTGIFLHSRDYGILIAAWAEVFIFSGIIFLNHRKKYLVAGACFILVNNIAVLYFGLFRQMVIEGELLTIFLCITATLIFKPLWQTLIAWGISISIIVVIIITYQFRLVEINPVKAATLFHIFGLFALVVMILVAIYFSKKYDTDLNRSLQLLNKALGEKNVTLEKRTEELSLANKKLDQANGNLRVFARTLAHEIRTEIAVQLSVESTVFTRFKIAKSEGQDFSINGSEDVKLLTGKIKTLYSTTLRLLTMVNNVLDIARAEETGSSFDLKITSFSLMEWANGLTEMMQHVADGKQIKIVTNYAAKLPALILSDRQMLDNAIKNLLINAVKFSKEGSVVTVNIYPGITEEEKLCIEVVDQGPGILTDQIEEIFEPFVTEGGGGTGLGLPIVKSAVKHLQGDIQVESELDRGSCFRVIIPLIAGKEEDSPGIAGKTYFLRKFDDNRKLRILIAEDQLLIRRAISGLCKVLQCQTIEAADGNECLRAFLLEKPDIVLLDVSMPGMNGYEVLTAIRQQKDSMLAETPVIIVTADMSQYLVSEFEGLAPDGYLLKPCTIEELTDCLNVTINKFLLKQKTAWTLR